MSRRAAFLELFHEPPTTPHWQLARLRDERDRIVARINPRARGVRRSLALFAWHPQHAGLQQRIARRLGFGDRLWLRRLRRIAALIVALESRATPPPGSARCLTPR